MNYDAFPLGFIVGIVSTLTLITVTAWLNRHHT